MLEKFFKLSENGTDVKTEILAGITTFMTMAYICLLYTSNPTGEEAAERRKDHRRAASGHG